LFGLKLKNTMKKILIVCTGNSCRSQMAEAWIRKFSGNQVQVFSAGTHPEKVNPVAVKVMQIECVDISHHKSNLVDDFKDVDFNFVITVCDDAKEKCPHFPSVAKKIHKSFPDPAKAKGTDAEILETYIKVRDMLKSYCKDFLQHELGINVNENIFTWIEIPVLDFSMAKHFYESLLGFPIHESRIGGMQHGFWGHTANQVGGAIVKGEGVPSQKGALVYFDGGNDLNDYLQKVEKLGGKIILPKTLIAKEIGNYAIFLDTEGNRLAFWSKN